MPRRKPARPAKSIRVPDGPTRGTAKALRPTRTIRAGELASPTDPLAPEAPHAVPIEPSAPGSFVPIAWDDEHDGPLGEVPTPAAPAVAQPTDEETLRALRKSPVPWLDLHHAKAAVITAALTRIFGTENVCQPEPLYPMALGPWLRH